MSAAIFSFVSVFFLLLASPVRSLPIPASVSIPDTVRTTRKHDVVGHYKLQEGWSEVFSQAQCPEEISIATFWHDVSLAPSNFPAPRQFNMQIPHTVITVNGKTCDSNGQILAVQSEHPFGAENKALIVDTFCRGGHRKPSTVSRLCSEGMVTAMERQSFIFGYDWDLLSCSGTSISPGHGLMFMEPKWNVVIAETPIRRVLQGGKKYLFMTRLNFGGACVYELFKDNGLGPVDDPSLKDPTISTLRNSTISPRPLPDRQDDDLVATNATTPSPVAKPPPVVDDGNGGVIIGEENIPSLESPSQESQARVDCFPATAKLTLADGTQQSMEHFSAGTRILATKNAADGHGHISTVYAFSHKDAASHSDYVRISTVSGHSIALSPGHYLYVNGNLMTARSVVPGHYLETSQGNPTRVVAVDREVSRGLFAPHTMHGDLIVDNIRVSSYTQALHPAVAHRLLAPLRILHRMGITVPGIHHVAGVLSRFAPGAPEVIVNKRRI